MKILQCYINICNSKQYGDVTITTFLNHYSIEEFLKSADILKHSCDIRIEQ